MSVERRAYPRYPVDFELKVKVRAVDSGEQEQHFRAQALNLSRTSIQFKCDDELVSALLRQRELPYTCELEFALPGFPQSFRPDGQVVTHRRVSQFQYVLVLMLKHRSEREELQLEELLPRLSSGD